MCRYASVAKKKATKEKRRNVYLFREMNSEAIRILLPVSDFQSEEKRLSFKAALEYGLRLRFRGQPIHLQVLVQEDPVPGGHGTKQYLVLYDTVPGGTGYLAELVTNLVKSQQEQFDLMR